MALTRVYVVGEKGIVALDVSVSKTAPTLVNNRAFDNDESLFGGPIEDYKGTASAVVWFHDSGVNRTFLVTGSIVPAPEGELLATPPFSVMELFEITADQAPERLQVVEVRGGAEDWDQIYSVAFSEVRTYVHAADGKRFFAHVDGYQEGSLDLVEFDPVDIQYEILCEIMGIKGCGIGFTHFNFDPEYFSIWEWKPANLGVPGSFPIEGGGVVGGKPTPLLRAGNPQPWTKPVLRLLENQGGDFFILETRFNYVAVRRELEVQLVGTYMLGAWHDDPGDSTNTVGPYVVKFKDSELPFFMNNTQSIFTTDSSYYCYLCYASGKGFMQVRKFYTGTEGGETVYNQIDIAPLSLREFPRELPEATFINRSWMLNVLKEGNYLYIFYMAALYGENSTLTPCMTVFDVTERDDDDAGGGPQHMWDVTFPTLIDITNPRDIVWSGRPRYVKSHSYIFAPIGTDQSRRMLAVIDVSCITKKRPTLEGAVSTQGNIVYPPEHVDAGDEITPQTPLDIISQAVAVNEIETPAESCGSVPQEYPDIEKAASLGAPSPTELHGELWPGFMVESGELLRVTLDRFSDRLFQVRRKQVNFETGVHDVELVPHVPQKLGRWRADNAPDWASSAADEFEVEASGYWFATEEVEADRNDRLCWSVDGILWYVTNLTVGVFATVTSLLDSIKDDMNAKMFAVLGDNRCQAITRDASYKIKFDVVSGNIRFDFTTTPKGGITVDDWTRNIRFGATVFGALAGGTNGPAARATFNKPAFFEFEMTHGGLLDISKWG